MKKFFFSLFFLIWTLLSFSQSLFHPSYGVEEGLAQSQVFSLVQDNKGRIWAGTIGGGISIFDGREMTKNITTDDGLEGNIIYTLFKDSKGTIWIGTDKGVSCYKNEAIINFRYRSTKEPVWKVIETHQGKILLATTKGIASVTGDSVIPYITHTPVDDEQIYTIFQDNADNLWFGTHSKGVFLITADGKVRNFTEKDGLVNRHRSVRTIIQDKIGHIWIGTDKGLSRYDPDFDLFDRFYVDPSKPESPLNNITTIIENRNGFLWTGSWYGGLSCFDKTKGQFIKTYRYKPNDSSGISSNTVNAIHERQDGRFWVGTSNGMGLFDPETGKFSHFIHIIFNTWITLKIKINIILCLFSTNI